MKQNTTEHRFESNLCIPCADLGKIHLKRKKKFNSAKFKEAAQALNGEQSSKAICDMDLQKQILTILFKHRANDRGNKHLNLIEDSKKLEEQDGYYADKILQLIIDREKKLLENLDIGSLRQWINERPRKHLFTNQDIKIMLGIEKI